MKTTKNTIIEPILFVDDRNGIYMGQIAFNQLAENFKNQAIKQLGKNTIESIINGPDDEFYHESCDNLTNITFKTQTGQKLSLNYAEGGIWIIPNCFLRSKKAQDFFGY